MTTHTIAEWDEHGYPKTLAAAAEDAYEWLVLIDRLHTRGSWKFSQPDSLEKLRGCMKNLREFL